MAEQPETPDSETWSSEDDELETGVKQMTQQIVQLRETLPSQLHKTLAAILDAQRPVILTHFDRGSEPGTSGEPVSGPFPMEHYILSQVGRYYLKKDHEHADKIVVIKQKISSNAAAISLLLKRLRNSMSKIDKLNSCNIAIHPAFKRKPTN